MKKLFGLLGLLLRKNYYTSEESTMRAMSSDCEHLENLVAKDESLEQFNSAKIDASPDLVLNALQNATKAYFIRTAKPWLRNAPWKSWKIKNIQIMETSETKASLAEIKKISGHELKAILNKFFSGHPFENLIDTSQFSGLKIVSESGLGEYTGVELVTLDCFKIVLQIYYDDEINSFEDESPLQATESAAICTTYPVPKNFHIGMIEGSTMRKIYLEDFPAIMGSSPCADICVNQIDVSGQHLTLQWDPLNQCIFLIDSSKNGTYINNQKRLHDGSRFQLTGEGHFQLTKHKNSVHFLYWNGDKSDEEIALLAKSATDSDMLSVASTTRMRQISNPSGQPFFELHDTVSSAEGNAATESHANRRKNEWHQQ